MESKTYAVYEYTRVSYDPIYGIKHTCVRTCEPDFLRAVGRAALLYHDHPDRAYTVFSTKWGKDDEPVFSIGMRFL